MMVGKSKLKVPVGSASSECCNLCFNDGIIVIASHLRAEATPSQDKGQKNWILSVKLFPVVNSPIMVNQSFYGDPTSNTLALEVSFNIILEDGNKL